VASDAPGLAPGAENAVEVDFLAYKGTMEEEILSRMGRKMKFAQLLYGKDAAGVLIESDGDDLAREIIADALAGRTFKDIGDVVKEVKIFGDSKSGRAPPVHPRDSGPRAYANPHPHPGACAGR
jgi:hypothetical protein